ncbi:MAG: MFS transporter [Betaproteobacteria bacterium]|nr:MFS transporter [Betaproteobacteria bacterium]
MNNRLLALCLGNVVIGTGTMVVQGMLPVLASGLDIGLHSAGRLIAAFAFTVCVFTPLLAAWLSRLDRRWLLSGALALFAVGHLASALATSYGWMLITRVVSALSAGLFTSQAAGAPRLLVPPEKQGGAVAMVFLGWGIAGVVGMPLSAWLAEHYGWQSPLWLVAISAAIVAVWVAGVLPAKLHTPPIDRRAWWSLARDRAVVAIIALTAIHSTGQFVVFAYIAPILKLRTGASAEGVTLTLALFGVTGIVGNILAVRYMDQDGHRSRRVVRAPCDARGTRGDGRGGLRATGHDGRTRAVGAGLLLGEQRAAGAAAAHGPHAGFGIHRAQLLRDVPGTGARGRNRRASGRTRGLRMAAAGDAAHLRIGRGRERVGVARVGASRQIR